MILVYIRLRQEATTYLFRIVLENKNGFFVTNCLKKYTVFFKYFYRYYSVRINYCDIAIDYINIDTIRELIINAIRKN